MSNKPSLTLSTGSAALMAVLLASGAAVGQERPTDRQDRIERTSQLELDPAMETVSCEEVSWHRDLLGEHPFVADACHDVVVFEGERWARFEVQYLGMQADRSVLAEFRRPDGRSRDRARLMPPADHRVILDGEPYAWDAVHEGQMLNVFVPEGQTGFVTELGATPAPLTRAPETRPREDRLARAEQRPRDEDQRELPATAGALPLLGLAGLMSLLGGVGLTLRRRLFKKGA